MRLTTLSIALTLGILCSLPAHARTAPEGVTYAIANPQRPGAKAPDCTTLEETLDGCTFHNEHGVTQQARLPVNEGEYWIATPGDATELRVHAPAPRAGERLQVVAFTPLVHGDADTTLSFDRISNKAGTLTLIERRRASVMIHTH